MKHFISIYDHSSEELYELLEHASRIKEYQKKGRPFITLSEKVLFMIFEKPSTRTRISFEVGMLQLGGHALYLSPRDLQMGRGETIADTARVLSRYGDGIMIRTFSHDIVKELAENASIPVINGLSDLLHPCQIMSDLLTIKEHLGRIDKVKIAYLGDGNNVCNSWLNASCRFSFSLTVATPKTRKPDEKILKRAIKEAKEEVKITDDPYDAVKDADILYTDVWESMGQEGTTAKFATFRKFQINDELLAHSQKSPLVMHCLPAHRGEEITDSVMDGKNSIVWDQAENRLHFQKALLDKLLS